MSPTPTLTPIPTPVHAEFTFIEDWDKATWQELLDNNDVANLRFASAVSRGEFKFDYGNGLVKVALTGKINWAKSKYLEQGHRQGGQFCLLGKTKH